jgi:anti-sigma B factor antagonist
MPGPPLAPGFRASEYADGTVVIVLNGDFDAGNARWLELQLAGALRHGPRRLVIDMADVGFADCASARLIVGAGRSLPAGSRPVISRPRPVVRKVLQVTGLDTLCDLTSQGAT